MLFRSLNSDASVRRLKIGRPINSQEDRKSVLLSLRCVDEVIIFDDDTPYNLIQSLEPDILTKGGDYKVSEVVGSDIVPQTVIIPLLPGYSTTNILNKMSEIYIT